MKRRKTVQYVDGSRLRCEISLSADEVLTSVSIPFLLVLAGSSYARAGA